MNPTVDLNADVGEHDDWSSDEAARERRLVSLVTTVHVACGFHAGGVETMRRVVEACQVAGVVVGAHPSYPDRSGFGRRPIERSAEQILDDVTVQLATLAEVAAQCGARVRSVKAHGALYQRMAVDEECAAAVTQAAAAFDPALVVVVPGTPLSHRVVSEGRLVPLVEGFCDRAYRSDGTLVPRSERGAVIADPERAAAQAVALARGLPVTTIDGAAVRIRCQTLCVHGDGPASVETATAVRLALWAAGVSIAPAAERP